VLHVTLKRVPRESFIHDDDFGISRNRRCVHGDGSGCCRIKTKAPADAEPQTAGEALEAQFVCVEYVEAPKLPCPLQFAAVSKQLHTPLVAPVPANAVAPVCLSCIDEDARAGSDAAEIREWRYATPHAPSNTLNLRRAAADEDRIKAALLVAVPWLISTLVREIFWAFPPPREVTPKPFAVPLLQIREFVICASSSMMTFARIRFQN